MPPVEICLAVVGHMPRDLSLAKIHSWKSDVFQIAGLETYAMHRDADGPDWRYTDNALSSLLPDNFDGDFLFAIVNVPLTDNYYGRRIGADRAVVTLHEVADIMRAEHIPIENAILRLLYSAALMYKRFGNGIPPTGANELFTHDETRGCLFDMNAFKPDLAASCHSPTLCSECVSHLSRQKVPLEVIRIVQAEIKQIKKPLYFRMAEWVKRHPVIALVASGATAIVLGALGSLIGSVLYAAISR